MNNKLKNLKGKTKLKFYKNKNYYYDNMNIRRDEDPFARNVLEINKIYREVILSRNFLQTKPQVRNMNINYYELNYTVIKNRDEKQIVDDQYENDYINLDDSIIPNHNKSIKHRDTILR